MSKPLLGLLVGAILGLLDGAFAWVYPDVREYYVSIVLGSTAKGLVAGLVAGFVARKTNSMPAGILSGLLVGTLLAYLVAMNPTNGRYYYVEIMLPGALLGGVTGYVAQRYGRSPSSQKEEPVA